MKLRIILITLILSSFCFLSFGKKQQKDYVTFVVENLQGQVEQKNHYPAGNTYRVYLTKKNKETIKSENVVIYEGDAHLTIYPSYRKWKSEDFNIEQKRLRIYYNFLAPCFSKEHSNLGQLKQWQLKSRIEYFFFLFIFVLLFFLF